MNFIEWWIELLNPFNIDATLFAAMWVLGMATVLVLLVWIFSRANLRSPAELLFAGVIVLLGLVWAPYAGFCMMLLFAVVLATIILTGILWVLEELCGTHEDDVVLILVSR